MPVIDHSGDLALLVAAAQAAAPIACAYGAPKVWDKPDGGGPVCEADLAVDAMLRERLGAARPGYGWLSEETADAPERLKAERIFIIDPIDGTRAYLEGSRDWAHSLAIAENGRITAACVLLPRRELLYTATLGGGAMLNGAPIRASTETDPARATLLGPRLAMSPEHWTGGEVPPVRRAFRSALAWRLCLLAEARFDAMLTIRPTWEWDIAAGSLILTEAGGTATDRRGAMLSFNKPHPQSDGVLAGGALHEVLLARLDAAPDGPAPDPSDPDPSAA
ncbi:3'(2'),5'-bisphosphate nucleotidase CysQ [Limimaricola cinnabarinus]|uniref:3'(2'),5'-bisphosphate nucleotidase CysQ n=1 Tax=Limimaricola cinnabarinus TaxID=1125964 RepID=A0A2G1MF72_9RHOB|nr:3'(2'),5'-bisphosphate nucleotidase CysQ [Limimaricola cinnabarinus]PHP27413.1 3'(2'),5'-bisphosphate nucleotidase CysQ [Limimaricola cinnabarinus]